MRNVDDLLGVEFVHDLYNRHEPRINSIRFRHTKTVWKDGILNSYAPVEEWENLGSLLGDQYYTLDHTTIAYTRTLYQRKRESFHQFIKLCKKTDLPSLSNTALASLLINFQSIVLGELYVLNFVQVEHGLNTAVKRILHEIVPDASEVEPTFSRLIQTEIPTASQIEQIALYRLAQRLRIQKLFSRGSHKPGAAALHRHFEKYRHLYSAYGELPKDYSYFEQGLQLYLSNQQTRPSVSPRPQLLTQTSRRELRKLHDARLNILVPLLVHGGGFRDTNKALLGQSVKYRFALLDEIARRKLESRDNLRFYLLSEICALLRDSQKLPGKEIAIRKENGVTITRYEDFSTTPDTAEPEKQKLPELQPASKLNGMCASPGICEGMCKVVLSKKDIDKVQQGDIMVAIGTDFDVIEAMYRAGAVITEEGGILSHASVVCRELKKPCCIGVKDATQLLSKNQRVRLDANTGTITILD